MKRSPVLPVAISGLILGVLACAAVDPAVNGLTRKRLNAPTEVQGYPCAAGYTWFFADGQLKECAVSEPVKFGEVTVPEK